MTATEPGFSQDARDKDVQLRLLAGCLRLETFSAEELAVNTTANPNTARDFLKKCAFTQVVGQRPGESGRPANLYALNPASRDAVLRRLTQLQHALPVPTASTIEAVVPSLAAMDEVLDYLFAPAELTRVERREFVRTASAEIGASRRQVARLRGRPGAEMIEQLVEGRVRRAELAVSVASAGEPLRLVMAHLGELRQQAAEQAATPADIDAMVARSLVTFLARVGQGFAATITLLQACLRDEIGRPAAPQGFGTPPKAQLVPIPITEEAMRRWSNQTRQILANIDNMLGPDSMDGARTTVAELAIPAAPPLLSETKVMVGHLLEQSTVMPMATHHPQLASRLAEPNFAALGDDTLLPKQSLTSAAL